jgi:hypothetical protein
MRSRISASATAFLTLMFTARTSAQADPAETCASLADRRLPNATITAAQAVTTAQWRVIEFQSNLVFNHCAHMRDPGSKIT